MTPDDVRTLLLRRAGSNRGDIAAWCEHHGVAHPHVSEFLTGKHEHPRSDVLEALDLEWRIVRKVPTKPRRARSQCR